MPTSVNREKWNMADRLPECRIVSIQAIGHRVQEPPVSMQVPESVTCSRHQAFKLYNLGPFQAKQEELQSHVSLVRHWPCGETRGVRF